MGSVFGMLALTGCSWTDDDSPSATPTMVPTSTPELEPTPTQNAIGSPVAGYDDPARWSGRTLTLAAFGGDFQAILEESIIEPFQEATGAVVNIETAELSSLTDQVDSGEVTWDVLYMPMEDAVHYGSTNYLEPIDYKVVDDTSLFPDIVGVHAVGSAYYSTTMLYPTGSDTPPRDWTTFWSVSSATPESEIAATDLRSLRRSPVGTLEFALVADGVPINDLYPLDVDRAFASLDRIRDNVLVWWQEGKEPIELLAAGQAGLVSAWSVRLAQLNQLGTLSNLWNQGMLQADGWTVPKGAPNPDMAMDFINYATRPVPTANVSRLTTYGPVNVQAFEYIRTEHQALLPSAPGNKELQFIQDFEYWSLHREELTVRFEDWFLTEGEATEPAG